eukprot:snap_masked-scaffold_10-processed-gene-4.23-mRNA-1 protein AED:0.02 eAED:0.02 QI:0/-1/0/1/-1/1/1/0/200
MVPRVLFLVAGPGAGKTTVCKYLTEKYPIKLQHLSAGDLLRKERANPESTNAQLISKYIARGEIVPVEITVGLIKTAMNKLGKEKVFLIDGYPRNEDNVQGWNRVIGEDADVVGCLHLKCSEETMFERVLGRKMENEGSVDERVDDTSETVKRRIKGHFENTVPILKYYEDKLFEIDAEKDVNGVISQVEEILRDFDVVE